MFTMTCLSCGAVSPLPWLKANDTMRACVLCLTNEDVANGYTE